MDDDAKGPAQSGGDAPTPRWVYIVGIIVIAAGLVFVAMHLASGGIPSHLPQ